MPQQQPLSDLIVQWHKVKSWLRKAQFEERQLREAICEQVFPDPVEGSKNKSTVDCPEASSGVVQLKLDHKINRTVDEPALASVLERLGLPEEKVIKRKPELMLKAYRALDDEQRAILDEAITAKPGSPQLSIEGL